MSETTTVKIARNAHEALRIMTWKMSGRTQTRVTQSAVINAAMKLADEYPERMEEILNESR